MLRAWQEVDDVTHDYTINQCHQECLGKTVVQNRCALQSTREQYHAGAVNFLNVFDGQRQLLDNWE